MKLLVELIVITAISVQAVPTNFERCTTTCGLGVYCKDDDCLPCPAKTYQNLTRHRQTFCERWTIRTEYGWVITRNGSATEDVQWKCGDQYSMFEFTPGSYECRDKITPSSASSTTITESAKNVTISSVDLNQTRATTTDDKTSPPDLKLLYILVPIFLVLILVAAVVIYLRCRNLYCFSNIQEPNREPSQYPLINGNTQNDLDDMSITTQLIKYNLFETVINFIGLGNCERLLINLNIPITNNSYQKTKGDYIKYLSRWANLKPDLNLAQTIRTSLDRIEFKLPPEPQQNPVVENERQSDENIERHAENMSRLRDNDIASLIRSLKRAERLNNAFQRLCHGLVNDLGIDYGENMLGNLNLTKVMEFKGAEKKDFKAAFCNTLLQWSYSHACEESNGVNQWFPLNKLKETLRTIERNDIIEKMEDSNHTEYNDSELQDIIRTYFEEEETALKQIMPTMRAP